MKKIRVKQDENKLFLVLSVVLVGLVMTGFSSKLTVSASEGNFTAYSSTILNDKTLMVIFSPEAKKLGVVIEDGDGKYLEGYVISDVTKILGKYNLTKAKRFGDSKILGGTIRLSRNRNGSMKLYNNNSEIPFKIEQNTVVESEFANSPPSCYWVCDGSPDFDWWECFKCCLLSPAC
ncbi:MAG: hypothetical protein ACK5NT_16025 [Pyrinomonadaceae bacterium]